jgi:CheY-like chemotaxis protein
VVWNLASNAVQFTPKGGRVDVRLARRRGGVELTVEDTGQGIAPEFLPHLFERFRQANASASRRHGGLGLGLSIVKHVVELHGGKVRAESEGLGKGARFVVELPAEPAPAERRDADRGAAGAALCELSRLRGARILVVDDEPDGRELVQRLLEEQGAAVTTAPSAPDALATLQREVPDVLVSDIGMPGMDGYELIRTVRAEGSPPAKAVPAIALTAFARAEDRARALEAGFEAHVAKPVEAAELLVTIAGLLPRAA